MIGFWIIIFVNLVIYFTFRKKKFVDDISVPLAILAFAFLIVAIVTKDLIFGAFGVPGEFEWIVGLFITGFISWKLYFNPMNKRIAGLEKDMRAVKSTLGIMSNDMHLLKEKLL